MKWKDGLGNEEVAETDTEKTAALEEFFTSVYTDVGSCTCYIPYKR